MIITRSERFKRDWADLPEPIRKRAEKRLRVFLNNPRHPSLRVGKLSGTEIFYGRITQDYRFTFTKEGDRYLLRRIGPHKVINTP